MPKTGYCFVLSWSFDLHGGGVNEVVHNLIAEFRTNHAWEPIELDGQWYPPSGKSVGPGSTKRLHFRFRPPCDSKRPLRTALSFLRYLPGDLMALHRMVREHKIAVFNPHFVDYEYAILLVLKMLRLYRGKVILSLHGTDIRNGHRAKGAARLWWKFMLRTADTVVACSDGLREEAYMLEPRANLLTIHNGIDVGRFRSTSDPSFEWPAELAGKKIITNVGTFQYGKGHDILLRAFRDVLKQHPDAVLILIGNPGPASAPARDLICELQLQNSVRILERVPHERIYHYLSRSSVFVMASRWRKGEMGEGLPIAILEAAAAGTPVVSTASTGVVELIDDRATGRLVPLEDPQALAAAICETLSDTLGARTMADRLSHVVRERFTWKQAAEKYYALGK